MRRALHDAESLLRVTQTGKVYNRWRVRLGAFCSLAENICILIYTWLHQTRSIEVWAIYGSPFLCIELPALGNIAVSCYIHVHVMSWCLWCFQPTDISPCGPLVELWNDSFSCQCQASRLYFEPEIHVLCRRQMLLPEIPCCGVVAKYWLVSSYRRVWLKLGVVINC